MSDRPSHALPASIFIGSGIIALGLYLGLRSPEPPPATPSASRASPPLADPPTSPPPAPPAAPTGSDAEIVARAIRDVTEALEALRPKLVAACWTPLAAKEPEPRTTLVTFNLSFDAAGNENGRGISETRGKSRSDVAQCLRSQSFPLKIEMPGKQVSVEVPITLP